MNTKTIKQKKNYFLNSSKIYFSDYKKNRISFLKRKKSFFYEISSFLNRCIHNSNRTLFFCCGNSIIADCVSSKQKLVHEINYSYEKKNKIKKNLNGKLISSCDHVVITDTEHQKDLMSNLNFIERNLKDDAKVILISKSLIWMILINIFRKTFFNQKFYNTNFLPFKDLKEIFNTQKFELIRNEKLIVFPFKLPIINNILNTIFRLPLLNFFCMINITIFKKKYINKKKKNISFIIPCKNEQDNIPLIKKEILKTDKKIEFLFGNDKSTDKTKDQLILLKKNLRNHKIKIYEGPGISKSKNVYKGIDLASSEIIVIYDADLTVPIPDILQAIDILNDNNFDFINCTRMIYPQKYGAMKKMNFLGKYIFCKII
mgnify:CR=1 FL=1